MKKIIAVIFLIQSVCFSQLVQQEWVRIYNGPSNGNDFPRAMKVDSSGNVYATGSVYISGQNNNYVTIKYNSSGVQQWVNIYNGPGFNSIDIATAIVLDEKGNVYVTGNSERSGLLTDDYCTIKYNSSGVQQWVSRYSGLNGTNDPVGIGIDPSGNVYVTGTSTNNNGKNEFATVKYDSSGVQQWVKRFTVNPNMNNDARSIVVDDTGNIFIGGRCLNSNIVIIIKYNTSGTQQWVTESTGNTPSCMKIVRDDSDNIYSTGDNYDNVLNKFYFMTIKYNSSGIQQWLASYYGLNNSGDDISYDIVTDKTGNVFITGSSWSVSNYEDYVTIKYNVNGVQQWIQRYNGIGNSYDDSYSICIDDSSNTYVTGRSMLGNLWNITTIKYNANGTQQWVMSYPGVGVCVGLDFNKNVFVTGSNTQAGNGEDIVTLKYDQIIGIKKISNEIPKSFSLSQNYPNPFNPSTKIKFEILSFPLNKGGGFSRGLSVTLKIFDLPGREVATLVNEQLQPGTYQVEWVGTNFASGIYFYKLYITDPETSSGLNFTETKKMVLMK